MTHHPLQSIWNSRASDLPQPLWAGVVTRTHTMEGPPQARLRKEEWPPRGKRRLTTLSALSAMELHFSIVGLTPMSG